MTIRTALDNAQISKVDADVLLAALLEKNRAWLLAHGDDDLSDEQEKIFHSWTLRREKNEPVAYITGEKEFYGRMFAVDKRALIPRPATEGLVEMCGEVLTRTQKTQGTQETQKKKVIIEKEIDSGIVALGFVFGDVKDVQTIVDIGTGSGCIAITIALEHPDLQIIASDISSDALTLAKENAMRQNVTERIQFKEGRGLDPLTDIAKPFLIVTNPPYIPENRKLMTDVSDYEPTIALFGGPDGLSVIRDIIQAAKENPLCSGIILECEKEQRNEILSF